MTSREFQDRLTRRARRANAYFSPAILEPLEAYFRLLALWNAKINLTALPMHVPTDETFDRLLIEPLAAARHILETSTIWFDLGSGGGSPAIPIKIACPRLRLTMLESKARKAAFLREAIRSIGLTDAVVANERFEDFAGRSENVNAADLITVRAIRADSKLFDTATRLLNENGRLLLFRTSSDIHLRDFAYLETVQLTDVPKAYLSIYRRMFHVEQSR